MAEYFTGQLFIPVQVFLLKFDIHNIAEKNTNNPTLMYLFLYICEQNSFLLTKAKSLHACIL